MLNIIVVSVVELTSIECLRTQSHIALNQSYLPYNIVSKELCTLFICLCEGFFLYVNNDDDGDDDDDDDSVHVPLKYITYVWLH